MSERGFNECSGLCFLAMFLLVLSSVAVANGPTACNFRADGDLHCPGDSSPSNTGVVPPVPVVSGANPGGSIFGSGSLLFNVFGTNPTATNALNGLQGLIDGAPDILRSVIINQAIAALTSGMDDNVRNVISFFTNLITGVSALEVTSGRDISSYALNSIAQNISGGTNLAGLNPNNLINTAMGNVTNTLDGVAIGACEEGIIQVIKSAESNTSDPYDIINGFGRPRTADGRPVSQMTIAEVMELQNNWYPGQYGEHNNSTAIGKYQFIRATLRGLVNQEVAAGNIQTTDLFNAEMQDYLGLRLAVRDGGLDAYRAGTQSLDATISRLARIWAGLEYTPGRGHYDGDGLNGAKPGTYHAMRAALQQC